MLSLLANIGDLHKQNKALLARIDELLARIAEREGRGGKPPKGPTNSADRGGVDVTTMGAASAATAHLSSAPSADIIGDRDLISNAPLSSELCTDQV